MLMELDKGKEKAADDAFFMERLEMLYEQGLEEKLRGFAERENRPIEQVKRRIAELHCRTLFNISSPASSSPDRSTLISQVLQAVSQQLESLERLAGLQSFFLVVDPHEEGDQGFLGGTVTGREFWRGHRGCGAAGALLFKAQCARAVQGNPSHIVAHAARTTPPTTTISARDAQSKKKVVARVLKTELYGAMRDALRAASGIRNAEMKWTNHAKLDVYGVQLIGWPQSVPQQNPSTLSVAQNQLVLDRLNEGEIMFSRLNGVNISPGAGADFESEHGAQQDADIMFEHSIDYSWISDGTEVISSRATQVSHNMNDPLSDDDMVIHDSGTGDSDQTGNDVQDIPRIKRKRTQE